MIFDKQNLFSNDQAVTNSQVSTSYIDLGSVRDIGVGTPIEVFAMMTAADVRLRQALASAAQSQLGKIETDIDLAAYEPEAVRPSAAWLAARRHAAVEIGALEGPLLLSAGTDARTTAQIADRLEALADRFAVSETDVHTRPADRQVAWTTSPILHIVDGGLRTLEKARI